MLAIVFASFTVLFHTVSSAEVFTGKSTLRIQKGVNELIIKYEVKSEYNNYLNVDVPTVRCIFNINEFSAALSFNYFSEDFFDYEQLFGIIPNILSIFDQNQNAGLDNVQKNFSLFNQGHYPKTIEKTNSVDPLEIY